MAIAKYPQGLRPVLLSGNSREQPAAFQMSEPRTGPAYVKNLPNDRPVIWTANFRFRDDERILFFLWFTQTIDNGRKPFLMSICTEFGEVEYEFRFLPDSLMRMTADTKDVFSYTAKMTSRELTPPDYLPSGIPEHADYFKSRNLLDVIVNTDLPEG